MALAVRPNLDPTKPIKSAGLYDAAAAGGMTYEQWQRANPNGEMPSIAPAQVDDSMANKVQELASKDSALNQMSRTQGLAASNARGLLNSSMAVGASQDALLKNVMPIASQDASQDFQRNQAARSFEYGMAGQTQQQGFQATQADLDRNLQTALQKGQIDESKRAQLAEIAATQGIEAANRDLQKYLQSQQIAFEKSEAAAGRGFQGTQAGLDRALQTALQAGQITEAQRAQIAQFGFQGDLEKANRELQKYLQAAQFKFTGTQAGLDRNLQTALQQGQITSAERMQANQIRATKGLQAAEQWLQLKMQSNQIGYEKAENLAQRKFQGDQAMLDRDLQELLEGNKITSDEGMYYKGLAQSKGIEAANRELARDLQSKEQKFEAGESRLQRSWQTLESLKTRNFTGDQAKLDRDLQELLQDGQISNDVFMQANALKAQGKIEDANRLLARDLQASQERFQASESAFQRSWQTTENLKQNNFQSSEADLDRHLQESLQDNQIDNEVFMQAKALKAQGDIEGANRLLATSLQNSQQAFQKLENSQQRSWQTTESIRQRNFQGDQAGLDRDLQTLLQAGQISSEEFQQFRQLGQTAGIEKANRDLTEKLQKSQQGWQKAENLAARKFQGSEADLDRDLQDMLQARQIDATDDLAIRELKSREGIEAANRKLSQTLQKNQFTFEAKQTVAQNAWQSAENLKARKFTGTEAELDRDLQGMLQAKQIKASDVAQVKAIAATGKIEEANRKLQVLLQDNDIDFRMAEGKLDRAAAITAQKADIAFQTAQGQLTRSLQSQIAQMNLDGSQQTAAAQFVSNMESMYSNDYNSIMGNTALDAKTRTSFLTAAKTRRDKMLNMVEQIYVIDLTW